MQSEQTLEKSTTSEKQGRMKMVFEIFWAFFKISPLTFGGGYVMIPLLERELVERKKWVKPEEIADLFAVSESVPGSIAVNSGTFIGYRLAGIPGAIAAMTGAVLPTFMIILTLSILFVGFKDHPTVQAAFQGIRPTIVALIIVAGIKIGKTAVIDRTTLVLVAITTSVMLFSHIHPIATILSGAVAGIVLMQIKKLLKAKKESGRE
ncbi:MAG: chromate transporter [Bacillaceae bacterium]|nr:chromate transporter [Bacillaceae bacterium]